MTQTCDIPKDERNSTMAFPLRSKSNVSGSEVFAGYSSAVRKLARGLLEGISESLGLETGYIDKAMNMESSLQILTANLYPPCPQPELAMGLPPHSDHGLLTILMQNGIGGLQVNHGGRSTLVITSRL